MNVREKIKKFVINTKIYDIALPQKGAQTLYGDIQVPEPDAFMKMEVIFNTSAYDQNEFYRYELTQDHKGPVPKTDQEKARQKVYNILDEQLDKVISVMEELGCKLRNTSIIGDKLEDNMVHVILYRQQTSDTDKEERNPITNVRSVVPDRQFLINQASEMFA